MKINALTSFMNEIESFCKKPKIGYSSCKQDIIDEFGDLADIDSFFDKRDLIQFSGHKRLNKTRLANSGQRIGKRGGFRVLYIVDKIAEEVTFLHIYPKAGSLGKSNVTDKELKEILTRYIFEKKNDLLILLTKEEDLLKVLK